MWERFEIFTDRFVLCAQRACIAHNMQQAGSDAGIEKWISTECTEFTQDKTLPRGTRVMVLRKSDYDLGHAFRESKVVTLNPIDPLTIISTFPEGTSLEACATWWLYFSPSPDVEGFGWDFERAEMQIGAGPRMPSEVTAWIQDILCNVGETKLVRGPNFFRYDISGNSGSLILKTYSPNIYQFFKQWTKKGAPLAEMAFGLAHAYGHGVPQDDAAAAEWYGKAAKKGHALAQIVLGFCHAAGKGVPYDPAQAISLFRRAAAHGKAHALCLLGNVFKGGFGVDADLERARECYLAGVSAGGAMAEYLLGELYQSGSGVPMNYDEACRWFVRAAVHGYDKALTNLFILERKDPPARYDWPTPGERRTRMAGFLKQRTSRRGEQELMEVVLSVADLFDAAIARGELSDQERDGIVEAAGSRHALVWDPTTSLIVEAQNAGFDMSSVLGQLFQSSNKSARMMAVRCINDMKNKPKIATEILAMAKTDKSAKVRDWVPRESRAN